MGTRHTLEAVAGALKDIASEQFLCNQGAVQGSRCVQVRVAMTDFGCALTDSSGVATLDNLKLHSDVALSHDLTVWRFVAANAFPDIQISCLNTYSSWLPVCRSPLMSVKVLNRIQRIEAVSGAGAVAGTVEGQRSVQVAANSSNHTSETTLSISLRCHGNATAGDVACGTIEARLLRVWNSRSHMGVAILGQRFTATDNGGGVLSLTLNTRLAGIYVLELVSFGARDLLFVRMRHEVSVLKQLEDLNVFRNSTYDSHAKNVSNIGRVHSQQIRMRALDSNGAPVYGAQVWVEMVASGDASSPAGQLSGCVSEEQAWVPRPLTCRSWSAAVGECLSAVSDVSNPVATTMPRLSVSAALPGTYKFRVHVFNPTALPPMSDLASILTHEFYVKDSVVMSLERQPADRVAGGQTRKVGGAGQPHVDFETELLSVGIEVVRWEGHTSFMYADAWVPPVIHAEVAGVTVSPNSVANGDSEHVNVSLQGLSFGDFRPAQRIVSPVSGLPTTSAQVTIAGRSRSLSFGRYCIAVGGKGILRSNRSRDDSSTLWLPEGTTGSSAVKSVGVSTHSGLSASGKNDRTAPTLCSRAFAVSERVYALVVLGEYPRRIGQGEEFDVEVRATLASGEPVEGVVVEAELARVMCGSAVETPVKNTGFTNQSQEGLPTMGKCDLTQTSLEFKGTNGMVDVLGLNREAVVVTSTWTTKIRLTTTTGHALKGSVAVTDSNGVAKVPVLLSRARAGMYRLRFRSGATLSHPTDVITVTSIANGIRILEPMVGVSEQKWVAKVPLGPYDFSGGGAGSSMIVSGVHSITGDLSSDMTMQKPDVQVVDSYGNAIKRGEQVSVHLVTCGRKFMANGTIPFPPTADSACEEFLDWDLGERTIWVCRTAGKCDAGFTRFRQIRFHESARTGFYHVFFASDGYIIEQEEPLYVENTKLPADSSVLSYRMAILMGLMGLPMVFNANLVNRQRFWIQITLAAMGFFTLFAMLYFQATLASYGSPSKVQRELVMCACLMVVSVGSVALISLRLTFQPDNMQYFTARQNKYLKAMNVLLGSTKKSPAPNAGPAKASSNRIYPDNGSPAKREYKMQPNAVAPVTSQGPAQPSPKGSTRSDGSQKPLLANGKDFGMGKFFSGSTGSAQGESKAAEDQGGEAAGAKGEAGSAAPKVRGRKGKPVAETGGSSGAEPQAAAAAGAGKKGGATGRGGMRQRNLLNATARAMSGGGDKKKWRLPKLPSLQGLRQSVKKLKTKEGREELSEYWGKVMEDTANFLSGAKVSADGVVQEGFQYPMRLLAGMALSLVGLCIMLVGFDSATSRTSFGLERLRAEVVRYRVGLGNFDTSIDLPQEKAALPTPPYSDQYDIVALTYTVMESLYGDGAELFESLLACLTLGNRVAGICVVVAWSWTSVQTMRRYRQMILAIRADRSLVDHWKFPIHEAAGYPGRQLWASLGSGLLIWLPSALLVTLCTWGPSARFFILYILLPVGGLCLIEFVSFIIRRFVNKLACDGPYIKNRTIFGVYDFIGAF